jgi:hypothetical protein
MNRPLLHAIADRLEYLGLGPLAAGLLEAGAGPLGFLAAQGLYVAQPALGLLVDEERLARLADWLEHPADLNGLADRLQGQTPGQTGGEPAARPAP